MTWGEFKRLVEQAGVKDEAIIEYVDIYPKHPDVEEANYKWWVDWEDVEGTQVIFILGEHPAEYEDDD